MERLRRQRRQSQIVSRRAVSFQPSPHRAFSSCFSGIVPLNVSTFYCTAIFGLQVLFLRSLEHHFVAKQLGIWSWKCSSKGNGSSMQFKTKRGMFPISPSEMEQKKVSEIAQNPKRKLEKTLWDKTLWEFQIEFFNFEIWVGTRGSRVSGYPKRSDDAVCIGNISVVLAFSARLPAARFAVSLRPEVAAECDTDAARSWRHNRPRRNFVPPNGALWAKQQTVCYLCK